MIDPRGTLSRSFWLAPVDARPLAVLRILFGSILLFQLLDLWPDATLFFSNVGVLPHQDPAPETFGLLLFFVTPMQVKAVLVVYGLALVAFTVGLFTRAASVVAWILCVSVHHRMGGILTGGDYLAQLFLFLSIFADVGACLSLDARRAGVVRREVSPFGLRSMQVLLALLYLVTARLKHKGTWGGGEGIRLSLEMFQFTRPLGAWLHAHPNLCVYATFVILALSPIRTRASQLGAALVGLAIQLGILLTMRVGPFTLFMLSTTVLFVPSDLWDRVLPFGEEPEAPAASRARVATSAAVLALVTALNVSSALVGSRLPAPRVVRDAQTALGLGLAYGLFDQAYEVSWYEVLTTSEGGRTSDLVPRLAPALGEGRVGWLFSPWTKAAFGLHHHRASELASFFCRAYRDDVGPGFPRHLRLVHHHYTQVTERTLAPRLANTLWDAPCPESDAAPIATRASLP